MTVKSFHERDLVEPQAPSRRFARMALRGAGHLLCFAVPPALLGFGLAYQTASASAWSSYQVILPQVGAMIGWAAGYISPTSSIATTFNRRLAWAAGGSAFIATLLFGAGMHIDAEIVEREARLREQAAANTASLGHLPVLQKSDVVQVLPQTGADVCDDRNTYTKPFADGHSYKLVTRADRSQVRVLCH